MAGGSIAPAAVSRSYNACAYPARKSCTRLWLILNCWQPGWGPAGRAAQEGRLVHVPDLRQADDPVARTLGEQAGFVTCYALPLRGKDRLQGVLQLLHRAPLRLESHWLEFLESIAALAAIAIDHAQLVRGLEQSVQAARAAQDHLIRSARLSAVGELAAGVAHQISNPLTTVVTDAHVLLNVLEPEHPALESAQAIYQAAWRAQRVVRRLLNFARPGEGEFLLTDLNETVTEALELVAAHVRRTGAELDIALATDLPSIVANGQQLEEVWINLLLNARDALVKGRPGRIRIASRPVNDGAAVEVEIADNGEGITAADQSRLFTPFFTTKSSERGYGLGLSVCQSIVRAHGGEIAFDSTPGQGTTFRVRLPLPHAAPSHPEEAHDSILA